MSTRSLCAEPSDLLLRDGSFTFLRTPPELRRDPLGRWCLNLPFVCFRGEFGLREYSEVKTVTVKIPQKNS